MKSSEEPSRPNAEFEPSQPSGVYDEDNDSTSSSKDNWAKIADELNSSSSQSDWNSPAQTSRPDLKRSPRAQYQDPSQNPNDVYSRGARYDRNVPPRRDPYQVSYDEVDKIGEDYETRAKYRERSVWNRGEWSATDRGERFQENDRYDRRFQDGRPNDRNGYGGDRRQGGGFRQDNRYNRAPNRPGFRGERQNFGSNDQDPRRRGAVDNQGGYRDGNYRDGNYRDGSYRDGGYRNGGYRNGGRREGSFRQGNNFRNNDGYRPNGDERPNNRYADRRDFRRNGNDFNAPNNNNNNNATDNRRPQADASRPAGRRDYRNFGNNDSQRNNWRRNSGYVEMRNEDPRRRSYSEGRMENLEPTIGALGKKGEPLSLAEVLASRRYKRPSGTENAEDVKTPNEAEGLKEVGENNATTIEASVDPSEKMEIVELEKMEMSELVAEARRQNLETIEGEARRDLIIRVLRARLEKNGLQFGEGTLEILPDEFGFLRSPNSRYVSCPDDIYISPSQIRRFGLRDGLTIFGQIRPPKERERYFALLRVESINGQDPNILATKPYFEDLVVARPTEQLKFEKIVDASTDAPQTAASEKEVDENKVCLEKELRIADLVAPIGFGQRMLLVYPPRVSQTTLMEPMAKTLLDNYPDLFVFVVLIDQRPEDVTEMERLLRGPRCEVVGSTFDEQPIRHIQISEIAFEKAKRMVEYGQNVVILLDSLDRLTHAWNTERAPSDVAFAGGLEPTSLQRPKKLFSSARNIDGGGSLTIVASTVFEEGNQFDEMALEEFQGAGNAELWLDAVSNQEDRLVSVNPVKSCVRDVKDLFSDEDYARFCALQKRLSETSVQDAKQFLQDKLQETSSNVELLRSIEVEA